MTKAEIVNNISEKTGIEKNTTLAVVETLMLEVKDAIKNNNSVYLRGFGTFSAKKKKTKNWKKYIEKCNNNYSRTPCAFI